MRWPLLWLNVGIGGRNTMAVQSKSWLIVNVLFSLECTNVTTSRGRYIHILSMCFALFSRINITVTLQSRIYSPEIESVHSNK